MLFLFPLQCMLQPDQEPGKGLEIAEPRASLRRHSPHQPESSHAAGSVASEDDVERLNRAWHRLQAWPDSVSGLTAIRRTYLVGPLSNGNTSLLLNMAKDAGLPWDVIIGSDPTPGPISRLLRLTCAQPDPPEWPPAN